MLVAVGVLLSPMRASAATAPLTAPVLMSAPLASPVRIHWTPAVASGGSDVVRGHGNGNGHGHGHSAASASIQAVLRADGPCAAPVGVATAVATFADTTTSDFSEAVADGTYCYSIAVTDAESTASSPGLTVVVDALPAIPVAVAPADGGAVIQTASVSTAGVATPAVPPPLPPPTRLSIALRRMKLGTGRVAVTVRWTNPVAPDLAHVDVVMNSQRPPRDPSDGVVVYRGLGTSVVLTLHAGQRRYLALFARDSRGQVSAPARRVVSLASLVPLRPITGSSVGGAPVLTWKPSKGASYYNVQVFRNGKRVLIAWPSRPSYRIPAGKLTPGTYVWFVWPALGATRANARFGGLIGRAVFVTRAEPLPDLTLGRARSR
jgi:hypothetical protein